MSHRERPATAVRRGEVRHSRPRDRSRGAFFTSFAFRGNQSNTFSAMSSFRTEIAGVSVIELARRFGTPTFVYDAAMIRRRIADLAAFDVVRYAQKACSNLAIVDLIRREGALVDTVSAGEIRRALAAGYAAAGDPPPIVYTADIFDAESLDLCVEQNIHVNCGSPDMIDQLASALPAETSPCGSIPASATATAKRPTPAVSSRNTASGTGKSASAWIGQNAIGLTVAGLHMHIGSGTDLEHLSQVCGAIEQAAADVGPQSSLAWFGVSHGSIPDAR